MSEAPQLVVGIPAYEGGAHLREALESLLAQTYPDVAIAVVDDGGAAGTEELVEQYARAFPERLRYERNPERLGMVGNWRRAFEAATAMRPGARYFAWGSDHDVWHPRWAEELVSELERTRGVLSYPLNYRIDAEGRIVMRPSWRFETRGVRGSHARVAKTVLGMSGGNMVYGVYRAECVRRAGVFHHVLIPDRPLFAQLAAFGEMVQVPEILWYRRFVHKTSHARQRAQFFPAGAPAYMHLPWWLPHVALLVFRLVVRGTGRPDVGRLKGASVALVYLGCSLWVHVRSRSKRLAARRRRPFPGRPRRPFPGRPRRRSAPARAADRPGVGDRSG